MDTPQPQGRRRRRQVVALKLSLLAVWAAAGFGACFIARELQFALGPWPFGYWMATQGAMIIFTLIVVVDAWAMNRLTPDEGDAGAAPGPRDA